MSNFDTTRILTDPNLPGAPGSNSLGQTSDRTMIVPSGVGGATQMPMGAGDAFRTQMGGVTTCPVCKSSTPLMESYCGDCGYLLTSSVSEDLVVPTEEAPAAELVDVATGRRYRLRAGANTLGRQGTDVLIDDGTVSRAHARITVDLDAGGVVVEDLGSSNGTKVGDVRIGPNQAVAATPGAVLRFGTWRATLEVGGQAGSSTAAQADRTVVVSDTGQVSPVEAAGVSTDTVPVVMLEAAARREGDRVGCLQRTEGPGSDIDIFPGTASIGRKVGAAVVITGDAYLSGRHAEITADSGGVYLVDLASSNGTLVNGQKLLANDRQLLVEGDEIRLGQTTYRFQPHVPAQDGLADPGGDGAEVTVDPSETAPVGDQDAIESSIG